MTINMYLDEEKNHNVSKVVTIVRSIVRVLHALRMPINYKNFTGIISWNNSFTGIITTEVLSICIRIKICKFFVVLSLP